MDILEKNGLVFSGYHLREDNTKLMEYVELKNHPWFVASQFHPEFKSRPEKSHPLFIGFVKTILGLPLTADKISKSKIGEIT